MANFEVKGIHHFGFVVKNLDATLKKWEALFGIKAEIHENPDLNVRLALLNIGGINFVLNESTKAGSRWEKFLETHGEGLEHVAFVVDDIDKASEAATKNGLALRFEKQFLIHGLLTNFVESMDATDVELMGPIK